mmetsp:Transcript_40679/g.102394  ORF Transcript_40679/g.102394 Transcript_40679/m.102394 type:complete len:223 (-) Transcript_40679:46-714(-)
MCVKASLCLGRHVCVHLSALHHTGGWLLDSVQQVIFEADGEAGLRQPLWMGTQVVDSANSDPLKRLDEFLRLPHLPAGPDAVPVTHKRHQAAHIVDKGLLHHHHGGLGPPPGRCRRPLSGRIGWGSRCGHRRLRWGGGVLAGCRGGCQDSLLHPCLSNADLHLRCSGLFRGGLLCLRAAGGEVKHGCAMHPVRPAHARVPQGREHARVRVAQKRPFCTEHVT